MRQPDFWQTDGLSARLLDPLGRLIGLAAQLRRWYVRPWRAPVPVICVGNLTVGGTGKTPLVILLAGHLRGAGRKPHILSRGYGGRERGPLRVDPGRHDAEAVGDEALLLADAAPTWVARDRRAGARAALAAGADLLLLDDGYQNPSLVQDLKLLVVDGGRGFGNRRIIPAGPLREALRSGLARADAIVMVGEDHAGLARLLPQAKPGFSAELVAAVDTAELAGRRVLAFAGIGDPEKFFRTVAGTGAEIVARRPFADHHQYRRADLDDLLVTAARNDACAVTTCKDLVRIEGSLRGRFRALPVELMISDRARFDALVASRIGSHAITG